MKKFYVIAVLMIAFSISSCKKYLDIVPDNVATIDNAFSMRSVAERYLFSCYSYMPNEATFSSIANMAGDEFWYPGHFTQPSWLIAKGGQGVVSPYMNFWEGGNSGKDLFEGIRQCNTLLDNVDRVPDLGPEEKKRWVAETKFLKAYYHYYLLRMYGPIPLIKVNQPIDATGDAVFDYRHPVDECFGYIVSLIDEAMPDLPETITDEASELGRINKLIAYSAKAIMLTQAASPLFNGNPDYVGMKNVKGEDLFNPTVSSAKWVAAAEACKLAIQRCEANGLKLYVWNPSFFQYKLSDSTRTQLSIRNAVTEKWNSEIVWANTNDNAASIQNNSTPRGLDPTLTDNKITTGIMAPNMKVAEEFYSRNGVPIEEDKTFDYAGRYNLQVAVKADRYNIKEGYTTAKVNYNRENRYYADLGFDGGIWYGQGRFDENSTTKPPLYVMSKAGQPSAVNSVDQQSVTGYWNKKLVNYENVITNATTYTIKTYPWPLIRLSNLYLLYAETLNETMGAPGPEVFSWVNKVRARAGLPTVESAWTTYSTNPGKFNTQAGMREIIHRERLIELAFEGQRYWDLRRWKKSMVYLNAPVLSWDLIQTTAQFYYRKKTIFSQQFLPRDYFWPISESELLRNKNLKQNLGW